MSTGFRFDLAALGRDETFNPDADFGHSTASAPCSAA